MNRRKITVKLAPQTLWHLRQMSNESGVEVGKVIDNMMREHLRRKEARLCRENLRKLLQKQ